MIDENKHIQFPGSGGGKPQPKLSDKDVKDAALRMKLASKRTAEEWHDIYVEVAEFGVAEACKANPAQAGLIRERLRSQRVIWKQIRAEFVALNLKWTENFRLHGVNIDEKTGMWSVPSGKFTIQMLTREESITFAGDQALPAACFFQFWHHYKDTIQPHKIAGDVPLIGE